MKRRETDRGILLITTLMIIAFVTWVTLGFILLNRDSLVLGEKVQEGESALEAAYAGLHYVMMRFEEDSNFGFDPQTSSAINTTPYPGAQQFDAFPDGTPTPLSARYWGTNGYVVSYALSNLTVYETGATVVGILNGGDSHFQVHFAHNQNSAYTCDYAGAPSTGPASSYADDGFDDTSVAGDWPHTNGGPGNFPNWYHMAISSNDHSTNNLNNGSAITSGPKVVPGNSARVVVFGYAHGTTRVVEALLRKRFFSNATVLSGGGINVGISAQSVCNPVTTPTCQKWYITSLDPLLNNIEAGIQYDATSQKFVQKGGNITATFGGGVIGLNQVSFSSSGSPGSYGVAFALRAPRGDVTTTAGLGDVSLDQLYPDSNGTLSVATADHTGSFRAKADNSLDLPQKDLGPADVLSAMQACSSSACTTAPNGSIVPDKPGSVYYIPAGIYAFEQGGNAIDVYNPTTGQIIGTFNNGNTGGAFTISNYQIQFPPGNNFVVDSTINSAVVNTSGSASGNLAITLSPVGFPTTNVDTATHQNVLPTLAFGFAGSNLLGPNPATLTVAGNVYVQGSSTGYGAFVVQSGTSAPLNWFPNAGDFANGSWAQTVVSNSAQASPPSGETGDLNLQGNSQLASPPNKSLVIYADNNAQFNPIPTVTAGVTSSTDAQAYGTALNNFAGQNTPGGVNGAGGYWDTTNIPAVHRTLNNFLGFDQHTRKITNLLEGPSANSPDVGSFVGLDSQNTGKAASDIYGGAVTDPFVTEYLTSLGMTSTTPLDLYHYAVLSNYKATADTSWLAYTNINHSRTLDPVENALVASAASYAEQANSNDQNFGNFIYGLTQGTTTQYNQEDMKFKGLLYIKGSGGVSANAANYRFQLIGAMMTPHGGFNLQNAGEADLLYDPSQIPNFYPGAGGNQVSITYITVR